MAWAVVLSEKNKRKEVIICQRKAAVEALQAILAQVETGRAQLVNPLVAIVVMVL